MKSAERNSHWEEAGVPRRTSSPTKLHVSRPPTRTKSRSGWMNGFCLDYRTSTDARSKLKFTGLMDRSGARQKRSRRICPQ